MYKQKQTEHGYIFYTDALSFVMYIKIVWMGDWEP